MTKLMQIAAGAAALAGVLTTVSCLIRRHKKKFG